MNTTATPAARPRAIPALLVTVPLVWHVWPAAGVPDHETTVLAALADGDWRAAWWDSTRDTWVEESTGNNLDNVAAWAEPETPA